MATNIIWLVKIFFLIWYKMKMHVWNKKFQETNFASCGRTTTTWWDRLHQNEVIREASSVVSTRWWGGARQGCSGRSPSRSGSSSRSREDPGTGCLSQSPEGEKKRLLRILRLTSPKPQPTWRNFSIVLETKKKRSTRSQYLIMIVLPKKNFGLWNGSFTKERSLGRHTGQEIFRPCATKIK